MATKLTRAEDTAHAKTYRSPYGAWYITAPEFMASTAAPMEAPVTAPLRTVAAAQAAELRAAATPVPARPGSRAASPARQAAREKAQAFVAANAQPKPPMQGMTVRTAEDRRALFAKLNAMANALPVGFYALPRRPEAGEGQSVYFFKIYSTRKGNRIVQITGGVGAFTEIPMKATWQLAALTKIGADLAGTAALFGQKTQHCGFCAANGRTSYLTNDRSVAVGYGKHCADKHGLPW